MGVGLPWARRARVCWLPSAAAVRNTRRTQPAAKSGWRLCTVSFAAGSRGDRSRFGSGRSGVAPLTRTAAEARMRRVGWRLPVSRSLTGSSTVRVARPGLHRLAVPGEPVVDRLKHRSGSSAGGLHRWRFPVSRSLTGSSTVRVHRGGWTACARDLVSTTARATAEPER